MLPGAGAGAGGVTLPPGAGDGVDAGGVTIGVGDGVMLGDGGGRAGAGLGLVVEAVTLIASFCPKEQCWPNVQM